MDDDSDYALALALDRELNGEVYDSPPRTKKPELNDSDEGESHPDTEQLDPRPNVQALFTRFNERFFKGSLANVMVEWSARLNTRSAVCYKSRWGPLTIRLSAPILKYRTRKEVVEVLLHEMIHAYCYKLKIREDNAGGHGATFVRIMSAINKVAGTNITTSHNFQDEVQHYRQHWWRCIGACQERAPFHGFVAQSSSRKPGPDESWWTQHHQKCGGCFHKVRNPELPRKAKGKAVIKRELKTEAVVVHSGRTTSTASRSVDREHLRNVWLKRFPQAGKSSTIIERDTDCVTVTKEAEPNWQAIGEDDVFILDEPTDRIEISDESDIEISAVPARAKPQPGIEEQNALKRDIIIDNQHLLHEDIIIVGESEFEDDDGNAALTAQYFDCTEFLREFEADNDLCSSSAYTTLPTNDIVTCPVCCGKVTRGTFGEHLDGCTGIQDQLRTIKFTPALAALAAQQDKKRRKDGDGNTNLLANFLANKRAKSSANTARGSNMRLQRQSSIYNSLRQCPLCGYYLEEEGFADHRFSCNAKSARR